MRERKCRDPRGLPLDSGSVSAGKTKLDELISRYRPLDEINEAFEDMVQGKVARTVLVFD